MEKLLYDDDLLEQLTNIMLHGPSNKFAGLCSNAYALNDPWYYKTLEAWPLFTGNYDFPIPSPNKHISPEEYYMSDSDKWSGDYGKLRYQLLDYLIEQRKLYLNNESS